MSVSPFKEDGVYRYHLLRAALERSSKSVAELGESELSGAREQASRTFALESLVLSSPEARCVDVPDREVDAAVARVVSRYADHDEFLADLSANALTQSTLREALRRELVFAAVLDHVAADRPRVNRHDARLYYEQQTHRFMVPEKRRARHILVTVNEDMEDNRREVARLRIETIATELERDPTRFSDYARRCSECPSALRDGELGDVRRGQLYPSLDEELFCMAEGALSNPIETDLGFHLLWLEKVIAARTIAFSAVESRITQALDERSKRRCQQAFVERLRNQRRTAFAHG